MLPPIGTQDITLSWDPVKYPENLVDLLKEIDESVDMPIIMHPSASYSPTFGIGFPVETVVKVCTEIPNIVGWKMIYPYFRSPCCCFSRPSKLL